MKRYGNNFDLSEEKLWNTIASYMDDDIREDVHGDLAPCSEGEFLVEYLRRDPDFEVLLKSEFGITMEEYYWIDLDYHACAVPAFALIKGYRDADGEKLRATEDIVFWETYENIGVFDDDDMWQSKVEKVIIEELGFLPDYEIN